MLNLLLLFAVISIILAVMVSQTQSVAFEELLIAIDAAGALGGDDMEANADPINVSPPWAHGIEQMAVSAMSNGDQLGASNVIVILDGPAFPHGPHEIPCGGHGGENIDLTNEGSDPAILVDLGIVVLPGLPYTVQFQSTGDTQDEFGCCAELIFQEAEVRQPKRWIARNQTTAAVNADLATVDRLGAALPNVPSGGSRMIGGVIGCASGDMAALGCHTLLAKLSGGVVDPQSLILGAVGGELIIGAGAHIKPSQRTHLAIMVKELESVYVEIRGVNEAGVMDGVVSLGFVQAG